MKMKSLPVFFHPSNVLLLDDQKKFIKTVARIVGDSFPCVTFTNPKEALDYLRKHVYNLNDLSSLLTEQVDQDPLEDADLEANVFRLHYNRLTNYLSKGERFEKIVVGCIDQKMREMMGLDFCAKTQEEALLMHCIMLTGYMGTQDAIPAFNEQIIQSYLQKEDPDLDEKLCELVEKQIWLQFQEITRALTGPFSNSLELLRDEKVIKVFPHIDIQKGQDGFAECYLLDASGSYLLINPNGKTSIFLMRRKKDFQHAYEIAADNGASQSLLKKIQCCEAYPYSPADNDYYFKVKDAEWDSLMIPMKKIPERDYYYAMVENGPDLNVFSYDRYLEEVWIPPDFKQV